MYAVLFLNERKRPLISYLRLSRFGDRHVFLFLVLDLQAGVDMLDCFVDGHGLFGSEDPHDLSLDLRWLLQLLVLSALALQNGVHLLGMLVGLPVVAASISDLHLVVVDFAGAWVGFGLVAAECGGLRENTVANLALESGLDLLVL